MEEVVDSMVTTSAKRLGLTVHDAVVSEARETGAEALRCGCSVDEAFEHARRVLLQAQPSDDGGVQAA